MQIYNVYQSGKRLYIDEKENPDNKIACNKMESEQTTLRLVSDGTLPPRLYWALRNPKLSNKYFILKLVNNEDLIVGTDISATPGLWDMLLIGTPDDYIIEGADIDQSKLTYVSDHFGRLFVRDNFLEELDFEEQCSPTFKVFYDEIMFRLDNIPDLGDIPDKMSDLENDTNFISGVAFKDDGEGNVEIIGTTFSGGETEEGGGCSGGNIEVDDELNETSTNPVQNKVVAKEVNSLKDKDELLDKEVKTLKEHNTKLKETIEKLQIKQTTDKAPSHHITDSANMKVVDFGMEGKTEQFTGTITDEEGNDVTVPNPDYPQEIKLAGVLNEETGRYEIGCKVVNKNIWDAEYASDVSNWFTISSTTGVIFLKIPVVKGQTYSIGELPSTSKFIRLTKYTDLSSAYYGWVSNPNIPTTSILKKFTTEEDFVYLGIASDDESFAIFQEQYSNYLQIELGSTKTDYVVGQSQPFTLTSPVPLTKWDYLTKRDGVYGWSVYRLLLSADGNYNIDAYTSDKGFIIKNLLTERMARREGFCNQLRLDATKTLENSFVLGNSSGNGMVYIVKSSFYDTSLDDYGLANFKAHLNESPLEFITYSSEEQSFHPLPEEEQTLLHNLETYYGVTNLYNDQGCPMWLCYTCDSKLYVDQKLEQINNALLSLGANV